jgi:hypothetical protein
MKRKLPVFFLLIVSLSAHAQRIPVVGITTFETTGTVTPADAAALTRMVITELSSWGTINVIESASGAEYVIRGTVSRQGSSLIVSASTTESSSGRVLNEYREQAASVREMPIFALCMKAVDRVPFPNYLLGTWQSTISMPDGPVVCIIEFKSDRTISVERYDTWEHRQNNSLRYEGYGNGTYSYAGYANRIVNINSQQVRIDAAANVSLRLEETLPEQTAVNQTGLYILFNADRNAFEIVNGFLPCGRNFDGPSVYPAAVIGFSRFTKIR